MSRLLDIAVAPRTQVWLNGVLLVVFVALVPPTIFVWRESIAYIAYLSVYAVIASHWSALVAALSWQSSKHVEDEQPEQQ